MLCSTHGVLSALLSCALLCGQDQTPWTRAPPMWVPEALWHPPREKPHVGHFTSGLAFPTPVILG